MLLTWQEELHPRASKGMPTGGRFVSKGGSEKEPAQRSAIRKIVVKVQSALIDELRRPPLKDSSNPFAGGGYLASEAIWHLIGGKASGFKPMFLYHEGSPHWFLMDAAGSVIDATASLFDTPVPYDDANGKNFLTEKPSRRAQFVIDIVRTGKKPTTSLALKGIEPILIGTNLPTQSIMIPVIAGFGNEYADTEVLINPTENMISQMAMEQHRTGDVVGFRSVRDTDANVFVWAARDAIHQAVEVAIRKIQPRDFDDITEDVWSTKGGKLPKFVASFVARGQENAKKAAGVDISDEGTGLPAKAKALIAHNIIASAPEIKPRSRTRPEVYKDLNKRANEIWKSLGVKSGKVEEADPRTDDIIAGLIAEEIKNGLSNGHSQATWYDETMKDAMSIAAKIYPEIATDPDKRFAFTVSLAITSQGELVDRSAALTEQVFEYFEKYGKFPTNLSVMKPSINDNFKKLNALIAKMGVKKTEEFLSKKFTVRELAKITGIKPHKMLMDAEVYGSSILGPKIGEGFYQNLNGNFEPITMDMWFMRTWGRLTGTGIGKPDMAPMKDRLVKALKAARKEVPASSKGLMTVASAIVRKNTKGFREGTKTTVDKTELDRAAERYVMGIKNGMIDAPSGGQQHAWIKDVFKKAIGKLADQGIKITPAGAQATIWTPEKALALRLGSRVQGELETDYAKTLRAIAKDKGIKV